MQSSKKLILQKIFLTVAFVAVIFMQSTEVLFAHGDTFSHEETKDGYFIDIGRDSEFPLALEPVRFDFTTYPEDIGIGESSEEVFTDVWVRISQDRKLFFSGGINKPMFGATGFTYVFPEPGEYEVTARFQKDADTVIETLFVIEVLPSTEETGGVNPLLAALGGLLLGIGVGFFIPRKKS